MAFSVRQCSKEEAVDILNDRSIVRFFSQPFTSLSDDFLCVVMDEILLVVMNVLAIEIISTPPERVIATV